MPSKGRIVHPEAPPESVLLNALFSQTQLCPNKYSAIGRFSCIGPRDKNPDMELCFRISVRQLIRIACAEGIRAQVP
jgi:hypothetical protein